MRRRDLLRGAGALSAGALAGCISSEGSSTPTPEPDEVLAGPNNSNTFAPTERTVSTGTTVTWTFESPRHNVACDPEADFGSLPDGAEPFTSYAEGDSYDTVSVGETYEHTFSVPGTYEYVCVPHVASGMVGTIVVEEE